MSIADEITQNHDAAWWRFGRLAEFETRIPESFRLHLFHDLAVANLPPPSMSTKAGKIHTIHFYELSSALSGG